MPLGMGVPKAFDVPRREVRVPIEVSVQIAGHRKHPGHETTFTQNVSSHGARIWSTRRWRKNERLIICTAAGGFQSVARVAYCEPMPDHGYVVGLELAEPGGHWVFSASPA